MTVVVARAGRPNEPAEVLRLVNAARKAHGVHSLRANPKLTKAAHYRAADMVRRHYFAHGNWVAAIRRFRYRWRSAGENIATGQTSPAEVVEDWLNSPPHRQNILAAKYTEAGIARVEDVWVNTFGDR